MDLQQRLKKYEKKKGIEYVISTPTKEASRQTAQILSRLGFKWNYGILFRVDDEQFDRCACIFPSAGMWNDELPQLDTYKFITPQQFLRIIKDINAHSQKHQSAGGIKFVLNPV